jgi:hypothetical protein
MREKCVGALFVHQGEWWDLRWRNYNKENGKIIMNNR